MIQKTHCLKHPDISNQLHESQSAGSKTSFSPDMTTLARYLLMQLLMNHCHKTLYLQFCQTVSSCGSVGDSVKAVI